MIFCRLATKSPTTNPPSINEFSVMMVMNVTQYNAGCDSGDKPGSLNREQVHLDEFRPAKCALR
jgi:hypothetical protein